MCSLQHSRMNAQAGLVTCYSLRRPQICLGHPIAETSHGSGITEHQLLQRLLMQRHDQQAKDAIGDDRQGWWPDDDRGDGGSPLLQTEKWPDTNRAAAGDLLQLRSRRVIF